MEKIKFKAAIFDLDGTLANTIDDLTTGLNLMLEEMGCPLLTVEGTLAAINCGAKKMVGKVLPPEVRDDEKLFKKAYDTYLQKYDEHYLDKTVPYDGEIEQIRILKEHGFKLAVISNKQDVHTVKIVEKLYGKNEFDIVMGFDPDRGFPTKPDPASVDYIISQFGVDKSEVAYIGDSDIDMQTGKNAGLTTFGVTWGFRSPELLVQNGADDLIKDPRDISSVLLGYEK